MYDIFKFLSSLFFLLLLLYIPLGVIWVIGKIYEASPPLFFCLLFLLIIGAIWFQYIENNNFLMKEDKSKSTYTSIKDLKELANDKSSYIRIQVAKNPNTPEESLSKLANDRFLEVREKVAENSNVTTIVLEKLANDKIYSVRKKAVENPNITAKILQEAEIENKEKLSDINEKIDNIEDSYSEYQAWAGEAIASCGPEERGRYEKIESIEEYDSRIENLYRKKEELEQEIASLYK